MEEGKVAPSNITQRSLEPFRRKLTDPMVLCSRNGCHTRHFCHAEIDRRKTDNIPDHRVEQYGHTTIGQARRDIEDGKFPRSRCNGGERSC